MPSTAPVIAGISSGATNVVVIDAEASIQDKHNFDVVSENTNTEETVSDEVSFTHGRFGDASKMES